MRIILVIATVLVIVGGLNWGLVGAFDYNLVTEIFGDDSRATNIIYILVGVSALIAIANLAPRSTASRDIDRAPAPARPIEE